MSDSNNDTRPNEAAIYYISKGLASLAVCAAGAYSMHITGGETGMGWVVLALFLIW